MATSSLYQISLNVSFNYFFLPFIGLFDFFPRLFVFFIYIFIFLTYTVKMKETSHKTSNITQLQVCLNVWIIFIKFSHISKFVYSNKSHVTCQPLIFFSFDFILINDICVVCKPFNSLSSNTSFFCLLKREKPWSGEENNGPPVFVFFQDLWES